VSDECMPRFIEQPALRPSKPTYLTWESGTQLQRASSACCSIPTRRAALHPSKRSRIHGSQASRRRPNTTYPAYERALTHAHADAARSAWREPCRASRIIRVYRCRGVRRRAQTPRDNHNHRSSSAPVVTIITNIIFRGDQQSRRPKRKGM
jgi:hypothetical protein